LANKYIIIAPKKVSGLKEKLKGILPVALVILGLSSIIKVLQVTSANTLKNANMAAPLIESANAMQDKTVESIAQGVQIEVMPTDIALWFLLGGVTTIIIYLIVAYLKEWLKK
jgi:hypothetical protein